MLISLTCCDQNLLASEPAQLSRASYIDARFLCARERARLGIYSGSIGAALAALAGMRTQLGRTEVFCGVPTLRGHYLEGGSGRGLSIFWGSRIRVLWRYARPRGGLRGALFVISLKNILQQHSGCGHGTFLVSTANSVSGALSRRLRGYTAGYYRSVQRFEDTVIADVCIRFFEAVTKMPIIFVLMRSPYFLFRAQEVCKIALLRNRLGLWFENATARSWRYLVTVFFCLFKSGDATILVTWLHNQLSKMSLFGHGRFLSTLFFLLGIFFTHEASTYGVVGVRIYVAGKISVTGNARKRSLLFTRGKTGAGSINTRVSRGFYLVRTNTGCLGLTVFLFTR